MNNKHKTQKYTNIGLVLVNAPFNLKKKISEKGRRPLPDPSSLGREKPESPPQIPPPTWLPPTKISGYAVGMLTHKLILLLC